MLVTVYRCRWQNLNINEFWWHWLSALQTGHEHFKSTSKISILSQTSVTNIRHQHRISRRAWLTKLILVFLSNVWKYSFVKRPSQLLCIKVWMAVLERRLFRWHYVLSIDVLVSPHLSRHQPIFSFENHNERWPKFLEDQKPVLVNRFHFLEISV